MKFALGLFLFFLGLSFVHDVDARPAPGELPSPEAQRKAYEEMRYRSAYARCRSGWDVNYCMAISLLEKEFCRKAQVISQRDCETQVLNRRHELGYQ